MASHPDPLPLDYRRPAKPAALPAGLIIALLLGFLSIWALFELQRMPYRPPADMSTLLGHDEIIAVRILIAMLSFAWLAGLLALILRLRRRR